MFQGPEESEPGDGGQTPGMAQQPRVHGVALPGLGRAKGWSFDGKQEVRGPQGCELRVLRVPVYHPPPPPPCLRWVSGESDALTLEALAAALPVLDSYRGILEGSVNILEPLLVK